MSDSQKEIPQNKRFQLQKLDLQKLTSAKVNALKVAFYLMQICILESFVYKN